MTREERIDQVLDHAISLPGRQKRRALVRILTHPRLTLRDRLRAIERHLTQFIEWAATLPPHPLLDNYIRNVAKPTDVWDALVKGKSGEPRYKGVYLAAKLAVRWRKPAWLPPLADEIDRLYGLTTAASKYELYRNFARLLPDLTYIQSLPSWADFASNEPEMAEEVQNAKPKHLIDRVLDEL